MTGPFGPGESIALAVHPPVGAALVGATGDLVIGSDAALETIARIEAEVAPRWIWWTNDTARTLVTAGQRPARCWDLESVDRLLAGGWQGGAARVWAHRQGLDEAATPRTTAPDLFSAPADDPSAPIGADGHLHPAWVDGAWRESSEHLLRWATLALEVQQWQTTELAALPDGDVGRGTARSESAAALLCAELEHDGLPIDLDAAEQIIATFIGPRPSSPAEEADAVATRDERVLRHLPGSAGAVDLRNPANVKSLLRRVGIEVPDTRAWRLETLRDRHPIVDALLEWRRAERIATTFGYRWLDEHVGADHRLRGRWSPSDGAAGRMTATAGLHNLPVELRPAVVAEAGHVFVRADLGQIEPRILAAVSGDEALATASHDDDMYAPVAQRLGVAREVAKVAVLGAMYGQTTGHGAAALRGLESAYPVAMRYLDDAARRAEGGNDLRTRGGRRIRMPSTEPAGDRDARSQAAARGRYGRNAMVQGAAAEFFKTWAAIVRARSASHDGTIVMCLHDELMLHCPVAAADAVVRVVDDGLQEARHRWAPGSPVRFLAATSVLHRWSEAH
jgi:DNA polymerase I